MRASPTNVENMLATSDEHEDQFGRANRTKSSRRAAQFLAGLDDCRCRVMNMVKPVVLVALLLALSACNREAPLSEQEPIQESDAGHSLNSPPAHSTAKADENPSVGSAVHPTATDSIEPANYLDQARTVADKQLTIAEARCAELTPHLQDDCSTSANVQYDGAIAAARVEYEAQLAAEHEENGE